MKRFFIFPSLARAFLTGVVVFFIAYLIHLYFLPISQRNYAVSEAEFQNITQYRNYILIVANDALLDFKGNFPIIKDNRTVAPLRAICETIGANLKWIDKSKVLEIEKDNKKLSYDFLNKTITLRNGLMIKDQPLFIGNNVAFGAINPICDTFGYKKGFFVMPNIIRVTRIYKDSDITIPNKEIFESFDQEISQYEEAVRSQIIRDKNKFTVTFVSTDFKLKPWEAIGDLLKLKMKSDVAQNFKVYWSQDAPNGDFKWEEAPYSIEKPCPYWYCWDAGEHKISAKIDNGYTSKIISTTIRVVKPPEKIIYLTFDDGPGKNTPIILDLLDQYNFKATFFMLLSSDTKYSRDILNRMQNNGHKIAIHGYTHVRKDVYANNTSVLNSMDKANYFLYQMVGIKSYVCRSPYGSVPHMTKAQLNLLKQNGYRLWDWNIDSTDSSGKNVSVRKIVHASIKGIQKHKSCVLLFHENNSTVKALPEILEYIKNNNFEVKIISDDLKAQNFIEKNFEDR